MPTQNEQHILVPPEDINELTPLAEALPNLPSPIRQALTCLLQALQNGQAVRIEPVTTMVTTSQAAQILNISRMTLVKLLDDGRIPYQQPNIHRQIRLSDILAYKAERSHVIDAYLTESLQQAEHDNLLMLNINDYTDALIQAKHNHRQS